jgi:hypothetical protein
MRILHFEAGFFFVDRNPIRQYDRIRRSQVVLFFDTMLAFLLRRSGFRRERALPGHGLTAEHPR